MGTGGAVRWGEWVPHAATLRQRMDTVVHGPRATSPCRPPTQAPIHAPVHAPTGCHLALWLFVLVWCWSSHRVLVRWRRDACVLDACDPFVRAPPTPSVARHPPSALAGIKANRDNATGYIMAFPYNESIYRENPDYVSSWLTHGRWESQQEPTFIRPTQASIPAVRHGDSHAR